MSAISKDVFNNTAVNNVRIAAFPASEKVYVQGSRQDLRVPMRKIVLSDTPASFGVEKNQPFYVYDTSGIYTEPKIDIDLQHGLPSIRNHWIAERKDTEQLTRPSSEYGRDRLRDSALAHLRFKHIRKPQKAKQGNNVSQMHYALFSLFYQSVSENLPG